VSFVRAFQPLVNDKGGVVSGMHPAHWVVRLPWFHSSGSTTRFSFLRSAKPGGCCGNHGSICDF